MYFLCISAGVQLTGRRRGAGSLGLLVGLAGGSGDLTVKGEG